MFAHNKWMGPLKFSGSVCFQFNEIQIRGCCAWNVFLLLVFSFLFIECLFRIENIMNLNLPILLIYFRLYRWCQCFKRAIDL